MKKGFIGRQIHKELKKHLPKKEITLLIGPRQSGKTTLLKKLEEDLKSQGKEVFYYNLDVVADREIIENQKEFLRFLENSTKAKKVFVIIDEVQRLESPGLYLKGIYDLDPGYKLIVSGSSSLEIKAKIIEPLTGRKKTFHLTTLSFDEFVNFKNPEIAALRPIKKVYQEEYLALLDEYTRFGGYPKVVLQESRQDKIEVLEEIYSSYIEKDIKGFFRVKNEASFLTLVNLLASQIGRLTNKDLLAANIGSTRKTVDNFLTYLEKSFVIKIIRPFYRNPKKELIKTPKVYFCDLGLRNLIVKNFIKFNKRQDKGEIFESFVCLGVSGEMDVVDKLNFWRTKTKAEVDFVVSRGEEIVPVEVKATNLKRPQFSKSFRSFLKIYQPKTAVLANLGLKKKIRVEKTEIFVKPFYERLLR